MSNIQDLGTFFLLSLSIGMLPFLSRIDTVKTGIGLVRVLLGIIISSLVVDYFLISEQLSNHIEVTRLILALNVCLLAQLAIQKEEKKISVTVITVISNILVFPLSYYFMSSQINQIVYFLCSSWFLGSIIYGMILGHWYLVVPKMSERPLLNVMKWAGLFFILKFALAIYYLLYHLIPIYHSGDLILGVFEQMLIAMRFIWGYVIIFILGLFTWKLIRMRSLQSATGILYVMVFFILIGELIAGHFYYSNGFLL